MTKEKLLENESFKAKQTESAQYNRVDKIEVNCGVSVNLWLVLGVAVLVVYLLGKVDKLEKKLNAQSK